MPVDMAKIALRVDPVAHQLLELPHVGKAAVPLAFPDQIAVNAYLEDATGAWNKNYCTHFEAEG